MHRGAASSLLPLTRKMGANTSFLRSRSGLAALTGAVLIVELGPAREARPPRPVNRRCWSPVLAYVLGQVGTARRSWSAGRSAEGRGRVAVTHGSGFGMLPGPTRDCAPGLRAPSSARAVRSTCPREAIERTVVDRRETNPVAKLALSRPCKARSRCGEECGRHGRRAMRSRPLVSRGLDRNAIQRSARRSYVGTDTRHLALTNGPRRSRLGDLQIWGEPA